MKQRIYFFLRFFALLLLLFLIQKPLFMLYQGALYRSCSVVDWLRVMGHGLPLDITTSAYLSVLPFLALTVTLWVSARWFSLFMKVYTGLISGLLSLIFVVDAELYTYWNFRLDATPLFYLQSPQDALASATFLSLLLGTAVFAVVTILYYMALRGSGYAQAGDWHPVSRKGWALFFPLIGLPLLFLAIRGGFSVATMNVGRVYFSEKIELNHAAINPAFSLFESITKSEKFDTQYRYFSEEELVSILEQYDRPAMLDSVPYVKQQPNVLLILLESFSASLIEPLGGEAGVTPRLNQLAEEGLLFSNCYANSFRTDRGMVSVLSGYPAQPTTSIMKYPVKSQSLPALPKKFRQKGYATAFLYGGDVNFTNMRSYLSVGGFEKILSDTDFPLTERLSKWGAPDHLLFPRLLKELEQLKQPYFAGVLTLSSHEPFEVPYRRYETPYVNSVAYTDSCLGAFMDAFRKTPAWDNTLVLLVSDHGYAYPKGVKNADEARYRIPLIWTGGALLRKGVIDTPLSQVDLAATLLAQCGMSTEEFVFSRDRLREKSAQGVALYTFKNGFGVVDSTGAVIYDCDAEQPLLESGENPERKIRYGKAYLQHLYDDLSRR